MRLDDEVLAALEEAVLEHEKAARKKRATPRDQAGKAKKLTLNEQNVDAFVDGGRPV